MDKIIYLYGSGRDSSTRALRRNVFPREKQIRLGPWIIRPSRRVAVEALRVVPHITELQRKVAEGVIRVERADSTVIDIEALIAFCTGTAPSVETPSETAETPIETAEQTMAALIEEEPMVFPGVGPQPGDPVVKALFAETTVDPEVPAAEVPPVLTEPEPTPEAPPVDAVSVTADTVPAVGAVVDLTGRSMPEGWEQLTAKELAAVCAEKGIPSTKTTKTALVAAVTSWLGGE